MNAQGDPDELIKKFFQDQPARRRIFAGAGAPGGVDLLSTHAAGHDLEVWRRLDFSRLRPQLILQGYGRQREAALKKFSTKGYSLLLDDQQNLFMARLNHAADSVLQLPLTLNFTGLTGRPGYEEIQKEMESRLHKWIQKPADKIERIVVVGGYLAHEVKSFLANYLKAEIHVFEPSRRYFSELARIYAGNPRVHCHNLAVAEREGRLRFYEGSLPGVGSLLPFKTQPDQQTWIPDNCRPEEEFEVQAVTLDGFGPLRDKSIDLLWCDVQGAELKVLRGAVQTLRRCQALFLEVATTKMTYEGQCELGELQRMTSDNGFYMAGIGLCPTGNGTGNALWLRMKSPVAASNQPRKKIVAFVPARNEGPRIAFCLRALARYADAIVFLDDCSEDDTVTVVESLAAECRVEKILRKAKWHRDEPGDRNALLQAGRAIGGTHFIALDADEAFTANCADNQFLRQLILALEPGDSLAMNWIQLWRGVEQYRFDKSVWTWNSKAVIFCDDGRCSYNSEFIHTPRVPGNLSGRCHPLPGYAHGLLHFQFVNWRNLLIKQAWYRCLEHIREPGKPIQEINTRYAPSKDETGLGLKAAPAEWLAGYSFFDLSIVAGPEIWREKQVLGWFKQFDRDHFRQLDIWDIEWGQPGNPVTPVPAGWRVQPHRLPEEVRQAQNLIQKVQTDIAACDFCGARAALESVLKIVPNDANLAVVHGDIITKLGDPAGARWEYFRALALQPNHVQAQDRLRAMQTFAPLPLTKIADRPDATPAPLVSAIVSAFNSERYMRGCLEDLTSQTLFANGQLEIIVIDSGSEQNEHGMVEEYQKLHANIVYLRTERETLHAAWNRGAKMARGTFLTNANADDRHRPDALEQMARALEANPLADLVYGDSFVTCEANKGWGQAVIKGRFFWPEFDVRLLFDVCHMGPHPLWRRSVHDKHGFFDADYRSAGDYEFWLRLAVAGCKMVHLPDVVGLYLERPDSMSLSDGNLNWQESEKARNHHWPSAWGPRPATAWRSFEKPVSAPVDKPLRVLLACDYFWPSVGGVEFYVEELGRNLQAAGCAVEVACRRLPQRSADKHAGLKIHQFECVNDHGFSLLDADSSRLRNLLAKKKFDGVMVLSQPDNWLKEVVQAAKNDGTRAVFLPSINELNLSQWRAQSTIDTMVGLLRIPDELVAVTEHGRDIQFMNRAGRVADYIPHAVEQNADEQNFRSRAGFDPNRPLLVMVANFWPVKNHLELLKVLEHTKGDWQLAIIGNRIGHLDKYHEQVALQAARDPRVKMLGGLPYAIAASAIRDADLLLVPSKGESAGPLVVLQAMSHGTAWIATPQCNAVADEAGGMVAELGKFPEVIHALLASPVQCRALGQVGREHWERCFTWKQSTPALLAILRGSGTVPDLRMPADLREKNFLIQKEIVSLCGLDAITTPAPTTAPLVSVIIPTHNRSATLIQCLEALSRQTVPPSKFEVIISDDGSTDDTETRVAAFHAPYALRYLRQKNSGPATARNRAIEQAGGYYLFILNDDAILEPDAMELHLATHESHPGEKLAVLGRFAFPSALTATPFGYALEHSDLLFNYVHLKADGKYDFNSFFTCNITLPREAVLEAGLFDEVFTGPAAEDIELGYRLFQRGYEVVYQPRCVAWHHHNMTPEGFCRVHRTRGEGAITLLLKQPDAPWYRGTDFTSLQASLDKLKKEFPPVERILFLLNKANAERVADVKALADRAAQMLPLLRLLQHYHELEGMLHHPRLPKLIELRRQQSEKISNTSATPAVSVIVTCYNYAQFLPEAVESVTAQTYRNFELIIVNDGSTDDSAEVANRLTAKHKGAVRIFAIHTQNTGQPAAARNIGIAAARGRYILCLDADDKIDASFLEKTVPALEREAGVGVVYSNIHHFGDRKDVYQCGAFELPVLMRDNVLPYCSLYRREIWERLGGYHLNIRGYEDWDFWLGACEQGWKGCLIAEPLFFYRKHGSGLLSASNPRREALFATLVANHPQSYGPQLVTEKMQLLRAAGEKPFLRITYLISSILGVTGGNQTLLRQAEELRRHGHEVTIVTYTAKPVWFQGQVRIIQAPAGKPMASSVPASDVVIATYFTNAHELPAIKAPVKIYYAQGDQFVFDDATMADTPQNRQWRELSRASYSLPGIRFVPNSRNLAAAVQKLCGRRPDAILPVCTDQTVFRPLQRSVPGSKFRLLIVGPDARGTETEPLLFKGIQDIHDALQILARKYPHFTAVRMSGSAPDIFGRFPCEFYIAPNDEMKTMLFGTAHIHIYASHYDSCPRPPQEAMAAGCAVVCTASAGAKEYCRDGDNALLVTIQSPEAIAAAVERLIHDHALREKLVQGGLATARQFPREREWNEWESLLFRFVNEAAKPTCAAAVATQSAKPAAQVKLPACALVGHLGEARDLLDKKKLQAAWKSACAVLQARSFHPEAFLFLGKVAQASGDSATARLCGQHASRLAPDWKPSKEFLKALPRSNGMPSQFALPPTMSEKTEAVPRLSVCLIVKNEERFLKQCLQSVRDVADQIVVVDTGSTDRTIEIAKEFNAEVHSFAWNDNFSAARNEALKYATGDWVLSLDADEELLPEHRQTILEEMQSPGVMGYRLPIIDQGREQEGCSHVPRLFRNAPGLFFVGRVHEQIFSSLEVRAKEWGLENRLGRAALLHHGYRQEVVASRNKSERNLRLLQLAMEELPDEPNLVMNLGLEKIRSGQLEAGLEQYREALRLMAALPSGQVVPELRETLLTQLTTHLLGAGRFGEIVELWQQPFPQSSGLTASQHFMLGLARMELKQPAAAAEQMRLCLTKREQRALSPINKDILKAGPRHCLALSLAALEQKAEAEKAFREALGEDPKSRPVRFDFATFQFQQGRPVEALKLLTELVSENCHDIQARQLGGQIALSQPEFLEFAQAWTIEAIKRSPQDATLLLQRAEALTLSQQPELALPLWIRAHSPNSARHLAAITLCEVLTGECRRHFEPAAEKSVSQEFLKWYRHLIKFKARSIVNQVNEKRDDFRLILPGALGVLDSAMKQAETAMAV